MAMRTAEEWLEVDYPHMYASIIRAVQEEAIQACADACWGPSEDHEYHWIPERRECWEAICKLKEKL
jgi:hypothetical protein